MRYKDVHIGLAIEQRMNELGLNKSQLALRIGFSNQYINKLFNKDGIDTSRLISISEALDYDFFSLYRPIEGDATPVTHIVKTKGDNSPATMNGDVNVAAPQPILNERIEALEKIIEEKNKLLDEKERTIKILMNQK